MSTFTLALSTVFTNVPTLNGPPGFLIRQGPRVWVTRNMGYQGYGTGHVTWPKREIPKGEF